MKFTSSLPAYKWILRTSCLCAAGVLLAACASQSTDEITRTLAPRLVEERLLEARIAAMIATPSELRAMRQSEDVAGWLDSFWRGIDPSPSTTDNEALLAYMQRAEFVERKFPEIAAGEWPELSVLFLRLGVPDWQGPEYVTWPRVDPEGYERTIPTVAGGFQWERMTYGTPRDFHLIVEDGQIRREATTDIPYDPPSLESAWETLGRAGATAEERRQALTAISWYEIPSVASRLLGIPAERFSDINDFYIDILYRMTARAAYRLDQKGAQRLAALLAAGAHPNLALRRAMSGDYTARDLATDLSRMSSRRYLLARGSTRGPHPALWRDPEGLLDKIADLFPASHTITGWDWRGDVYLAKGAPAFLDLHNRKAHYLWGTPEVLGIGDTMLGRVDAVRLEDHLQNFVAEAVRSVQNRRALADDAANTVTRVLSSGAGNRITREMLDQLHVLAPPAVYNVFIPAESNVRPIQILLDIVAFPAGTDSIEIQATYGIPTSSVRLREQGEFLVTDLRTNLLLVNHDLRAVHAESRQQGYVIRAEEGAGGRLFLDTYRFRIPYGSYIAYVSAEDPNSEASGGVLVSVDLTPYASGKLQVSPIMLASNIEPTEEEGKFVRGGQLILPAPARRFFYGRDLYFYYEVSNLTASDIGDHVCSESLFIIPNDTREGIISISQNQDITSLGPSISRYMGIDLSNLGRTYEGAVFLVVLVTDRVTGEQAVGATWLGLSRPDSRGAPPPAP